MTGRTRSRRRAEALQQALERYERALAKGTDAETARREVAATLGDDARLLMLAAGMGQAQAPVPAPKSVERFASQLRTSKVRRKLVLAPRRPALGWAPLALAACTMLFAALLVPSLRSLPGDSLYSVKTTAEDARVWFASGPAEARVRLGLANERFSEVERLVERAHLEDAAHALVGGELDGVAGGLDGIENPELAVLIDTTLAEAGRQIETAADILISHPATAADLDALVTISQEGHKLASDVADELPNVSQPPVLDTAVKLAKIEAKAKAARMNVDPETTPPPCATPSPSPEPTTTPEASPVENATSTAVESPSPDPTTTPEPTPCTSPTPSPTPTPTPDPAATTEAEPEPTPVPDDEQSSQSRQGDGEIDVFGPDGNGDASGNAATDA